jgi:hypothetical protein
MEGVGRQNWARGRIPIFRKIHLYAESVKSTHGHTKKKPTQLLRATPPTLEQSTYPRPTLEPLKHLPQSPMGKNRTESDREPTLEPLKCLPYSAWKKIAPSGLDLP